VKTISFILALYIFILNVTPCDHNESSHINETSSVTQLVDHHQKHDDSELCSPFCLDENCHINITFIDIEDFNFKSNTQIFSTFDYKESTGYEILYAIFQPPRV